MAVMLQPIAIAASWLALVALATGFFFAPRGAEAQPTLNDVIGFGCSMAISGAAAATAAFVLGGRRRWAVQLALSVLLVGVIGASLLVYFLWIDPSILRQQMDLRSFRRLQHLAPRWAKSLAGYHVPLGAALGLALGTIAGLLIRLGRRRPRLATGMVLAILFASASDLGRPFTIELVTRFGWILRGLLVPWSLSDDQISNTAMIFGAIAGAAVAGLAMYATRGRRPGHL
jgi:hypothetical protein